MSQTETQKTPKQLLLNKAQLRAWFNMVLENFLIMSRGTGKSFYLAWVMIQLSRLLPGSKWVFVGPSYRKLAAEILPGVIGSLAKFGYKQNVHYFVNRRPPKKWNLEEPFEPPLTYDHTITFFYKGRCTVFQLVSQDGVGNARGLNVDGVIGDEGLLLDFDKLERDVLAANRGNLDRFKHSRFHHAIIITSSMPTGLDAKWLLSKEEEMRKNPKLVYYMEASILDNIENVGKKYLKQLKRTMTPLNFRVEVCNERIGRIEDGFYPALNTDKTSEHPAAFGRAIHTYSGMDNVSYLENLDYNMKRLVNLDSRADADCDPYLPLELAVDWGARINSMLVSQVHGREQRFLKNLYVKWPDLVKDLAAKFCNYYAYHKDKTIMLYYDRNGNARTPNSQRTLAEEFTAALRDRGWTVYVMTPSGLDAYHQDKYHLIYNVMKELDPRYPMIRINRNNCRELIISMENTPLKEGDKGIQKDKKSEKESSGVAQEEATHLGDAFDILIYKKYNNLLHGSVIHMPNMIK